MHLTFSQEQLNELDNSIVYYTNHLERLRQLAATQSQMTAVLLKISSNVDLSDLQKLNKMNDLNALLTISLLDLITLVKSLSQRTKTWEQLYFIRQSYLTVYETLKSYDSYNSTLNNLVSTKYLNDKVIFHSICAEIKKFKKDYGYQSEMVNIRNYTSGHIDVNFTLFYDTVKSIDGQKATEAISKFINILINLQKFSANLVASAHVLIEQKRAETDKQILLLKNKIDELLDLKKMIKSDMNL